MIETFPNNPGALLLHALSQKKNAKHAKRLLIQSIQASQVEDTGLSVSYARKLLFQLLKEKNDTDGMQVFDLFRIIY